MSRWLYPFPPSLSGLAASSPPLLLPNLHSLAFFSSDGCPSPPVESISTDSEKASQEGGPRTREQLWRCCSLCRPSPSGPFPESGSLLLLVPHDCQVWHRLSGPPHLRNDPYLFLGLRTATEPTPPRCPRLSAGLLSMEIQGIIACMHGRVVQHGGADTAVHFHLHDMICDRPRPSQPGAALLQSIWPSLLASPLKVYGLSARCSTAKDRVIIYPIQRQRGSVGNSK